MEYLSSPSHSDFSSAVSVVSDPVNILDSTIPTLVGALIGLVVSSLGYIGSKRYERSLLSLREMVYLERLYNHHLSQLQTARSTIASWIKASREAKSYFLRFQPLPTRFEASVDVLDLDVARDYFLIHTDAERTNHDYKALEHFAEQVRQEILSHGSSLKYSRLSADLVVQMMEMDSFLVLLAGRIRKAAILDRIKLRKWREGGWLCRTYKYIWPPALTVLESEIEEERKVFEKEQHEQFLEDKKEMDEAGLVLRDISV